MNPELVLPVFRFAIELHPTADVSEYTATINYDYEENTDKVTFDIKAEGMIHEQHIFKDA